MNFADTRNKGQEDLQFVQQMGIVTFFLLFEQYGVTIWITSFWDTWYIK